MGEKFYIDFISDKTGKVYIDEPIGFNTISFDVEQKDKGYGRDIFFNGGEAQLEFCNFRNHYLDKLLYYYHYYGFEAKAQLGIEFINGESVLMDLDFKAAVSDDLEYFKCKCIEISKVQIVKRRSSVKVDLFSAKDIDSKSIIPASTKSILLKPKQIQQSSKWNQASYDNVLMRAQGSETTNFDYVNPCANIIKSDIDNTLSWFEINSNSPDNFYVIEAADNLIDINLQIKNTNIHFTTDVDNGGAGYVEMIFRVRYGADLASAKTLNLLSTYQTENKTYDYNSSTQGDFVVNIDALNRGDKIWIFFEFKIRQSSSIPAARFEVFTTISGMETTITAFNKAYYSATKGVRLIDAVKQVVKSISGLNLTAPILNSNSLYYDTFLFNGNLLRGITDKPFYLSLEDLENSLGAEINGAFETNDTVFFGREKDFYADKEIWFFDNTQFAEFSKKVNDRFAINNYSFNYKTFQSQKEIELSSSGDIIHGQSTFTLFNKMVENKKEISVDWIRDAFMIEETRRKSLEISDNSASQNSDNVFSIDTILNTTDTVLNETTLLYHEYNLNTEVLTLRTKSEPNLKTLGLSINDNFLIKAPDNNAGNYKIVNINENSIELITESVANPGYPSVDNNGERFTSYQYILDHTIYPYSNRTDEEITNINSINGPDSYSNMRFSIRRNIERNYSEYLSTCNLYWKEKAIANTFYLNNPKCSFTYNGITTTEGGDYRPTNPILSPWIYENAIFANVDLVDFITIRNALKTKRGFIRAIDKTGNVIKLYPKRMSYENLSKELNITGEAKYESQIMSILSSNKGFIEINEEVFIYGMDWEIIDHKLYVYDNTRQRLFNPVFWDNVTINGGYAKSEEELKELLSLL